MGDGTISGVQTASVASGKVALTVTTVGQKYKALLSGASLNGNKGKPAYVTYSFPTAAPAYDKSGDLTDAERQAVTAFSAGAQQNAVREALAKYSNVSGIKFFEVPPGEGDMNFLLAPVDQRPTPIAGFAVYPTEGDGQLRSSDVYIDPKYATDQSTLLHEIGHAVGLKHPFQSTGTNPDVLASQFDDKINSIMSYTGNSIELGPIDIAALQNLYGATQPTSPGNYSWNNKTFTLTQIGSDQDDTIVGVNTGDVVNGGKGNDTIKVGHGTATIDGGDGDDTIYLNPTAGKPFTIDGGAGNDKVVATLDDLAPDLLAVGTSITNVETIDFNAQQRTKPITIDGGPSAEIITGSNFADTLRGDGGNDRLYGGEGNDRLYGGQGNDELHGGAGDDTLYGGAGADTLVGGAGADIFAYHSVTDSTAAAPDYIVDFTRGVDKIDLSAIPLTDLSLTPYGGGHPGTFIEGKYEGESFKIQVATSGLTVSDLKLNPTTSAPMTIVGDAGNNTLFGGNAADVLDGGAGDDTLYGGDGNDTLIGGPGKDRLDGGAGADTFVFKAVTDSLSGNFDRIELFQQGVDKIDLSAIPLANMKLAPAFDQAGTRIGTFVEGQDGGQNFTLFVYGPHLTSSDFYLNPNTNFPKTEIGGAGNDTLVGGNGADRLEGNGGDDMLFGGAGDDVLYGGAGADKLYGGAGADTYVYKDISDSTRTSQDIIGVLSEGNGSTIGFEVGKDKIDLSAIPFTNVSIEDRKYSTLIVGTANGSTNFQIQVDALGLTRNDLLVSQGTAITHIKLA